MKKLIMIQRLAQLLFAIITFLFYSINTNYGQSQIGSYCGTCKIELDEFNKVKADLLSAIEEVQFLREDVFRAKNDLKSAKIKLERAETGAEYAKKAWELAEKYLEAADEAGLADLCKSRGITYYEFIKELILLVGTRLSEYLAEKVIVEKYQNEYAWYLKNLKYVECWLEKYKVILEETKSLFKQKQATLKSCIASIRRPKICEKCENDKIVADDNQDPGICKKCINGNVFKDNTEDPGICKKCDNGVSVNDDAEDPGVCKKCENGIIVNDDSENPGPCKKCVNGEVVDECDSDQQCCEGVCVDIEYEYLVTETIVTCDGSISNSYYSSTCSEGTTGQFQYSLGVCVGGSIVTVSCSGPYPMPCP